MKPLALSAKCKLIKGSTEVQILLSDLVVASGTISGQVAPDEALERFKGSPNSFRKGPGWFVAKKCGHFGK